MTSEPVTVFFSYSHKDEALRDELANHLEILKLGGDITDWHDRKILPGDEWDRGIKDSLNAAQIILLLVSSDFIASRYCRDIEITRAMERHEAGEACVIPVILRTCLWSSAPFGKLQALPKNAAPVTDVQTWSTKDDAFTNVAEGIKKAANEIRQRLRVAKQEKLNQYESTYQQLIQQQYPLSETSQDKLNRLQVALGLSDTEIAPIVTRLSAQYGEARQKLEQYRNEVRLCLQEDNGDISLSRNILDGFRLTFGLTPEEATAVEQEELQPYQVKKDAMAQYTKVFADALQQENPPSDKTLNRLKRFQTTLGLSDEEVEEIKATQQQVLEAQLEEREEIANVTKQQYRENFIKAIQAAYPLDEYVTHGLKSFQQQLELSDEEVAAIEQPIRESAKANYQQQLKDQEEAERQKREAAERVRQAEAESQRQAAEAKQKQQDELEQQRKEAEAQRIQQQATAKHHQQEANDLSSERFGANYYAKLRDLLAAKEWKAADQETASRMRKVVGCRESGYLSIKDIENFPCLDLQNINSLWVKYSQGRFGFSVQKEIWQSCGSPNEYNDKWGEFCVRIGWRTKGGLFGGAKWLKYSELTFQITAPPGHLPSPHKFGSLAVGQVDWAVVGSRSHEFFSLASRCINCSIQ